MHVYVCEFNDFKDDDIKLKVCACDKHSSPKKRSNNNKKQFHLATFNSLYLLNDVILFFSFEP